MDIPTPESPPLSLFFWFWSKVPIIFGLLVVEHIYRFCLLDAAAVGMEIAGRCAALLSLWNIPLSPSLPRPRLSVLSWPEEAKTAAWSL